MIDWPNVNYRLALSNGNTMQATYVVFNFLEPHLKT